MGSGILGSGPTNNKTPSGVLNISSKIGIPSDQNKLFTPVAFSPITSSSNKFFSSNVPIPKNKNNIIKQSPK
jgi:hypothetical protein